MLEKVENRLRELENTSSDFWNIPPESGNFLNLLIKSTNYKNILEVGTSNGYSAIWIADALTYTGGHLVTMEYYPKRIELAVENLTYCELRDKVTFLEGSAIQLLENLTSDVFPLVDNKDEYIDLAFVDACKKEYLAFFRQVDKRLKKGGMLIADNVTSHEKSMLDFLEEIKNNPSYQTTYLPFRGGLLIGLKLT